MKTPKLIYAAMILITVLATSCGGNKTANDKKNEEQTAVSPKERLDGKWKIVKATGEFASMNEGTLYTFEGTEKLSTKLGIIETKGKIVNIDDSTFAVLFDGMQNNSNFSYHFEGKNLILEPKNSNQIFTLEKQ
ncbi:MAG: hypothetical protein CVU11_08735 [Bacteroidetes bacterium HGW-Bacteroidetes-6]|jgi:hypothetical protein|nr:MAG: hypothetical protein CVU11_08735 [Bacteroidetes bacterium HGW-Bacteroidetes-6]